MRYGTPYSKARCPTTPTPPHPHLMVSCSWFFWAACLTLDIQQRAWALEVAKSYNPIGSNSAVLCLFFITFEKQGSYSPLCSGIDFTQEKGNFHPNTRVPHSIIRSLWMIICKRPAAPVLESPLEPASRFSCLLGACKSAYLGTSFEFIGLMAFPSKQVQRAWWVLLPILVISEKELIRGNKWVFLILEPASQARGLAWILQPGEPPFR